jgi:uncharacterized membrane protein YhaH (DUF805 family)
VAVIVWLLVMLALFLTEAAVQRRRTEDRSYPAPPDPEQPL